MRPCRSAIWLTAMLSLACLPALAAQHAQVGPQIITIPSNNPGQPITIKAPNSTQLFALQSFFTGAYPKGGTRTSLDPTDVTWVSDTPSVATVNTSGILTAVGAGTATITARFGRLTATVQVTVIGLTSLAITPTGTTSVPIGNLAQFTATGNYSDCGTNPADCNVNLTDSVIWTSSDSIHFPITNGSPGGGAVKVETTATVGNTSMISCTTGAFACTPATVTVQAAQATVDFVVVLPRSAVIPALAGTKVFTSQCQYSDGQTLTCAGDSSHTAVTVNWSSGGAGDTGSAVVTPVGSTTTATATGIGTVTITAAPLFGTCRGSACIGGLNVGLTAVNPISPANPMMPKGSTQQFKITGNFTGQAVPQDITNYVTWCSSPPLLTTSCFSIPRPSPVNVSINSAGGLATAIGAVGTNSTIFGGIDPCTKPTQVGTLCASTTASVVAPTLTSIAITPTSTSLALGAKRQYTAIGTFTDKSTVNITNSVVWISSDTTEAAFSASKPGQLIANKITLGTTNITATQSSITSNVVALNISQAALSSIIVTPTNPSVPTGANQQFTVTGKYTDGSQQTLPFGGDANHVAAPVSWSSSAPNAATIDSSGLASAIGTNGTTTIKATSGAIVGSTVLTVAPAALKSIAITPTNASIAENETQQFTATGTLTDGSQKDITANVTWSETDGTPGSASISNAAGSAGLATGVTPGTATIIATDPVTLKNNSVTMTITARVLTSIAVTPASASINAGSTQQFTATGTYNAPPTNQDITGSVTWNSDNTAVATVDASGLATGASAGTANITAQSAAGTCGVGGVICGSAALTVNNPVLQSITITPNGNNVVVPTNQTQQFTATGNYSDGSTQDLSAIATWTKSNLNLGDSIDATGLYTAGKTPGSQTVTATCGTGQCGTGSASASQNFTVTF